MQTDKNKAHDYVLGVALISLAFFQACGPITPSVPKGARSADSENTIYTNSLSTVSQHPAQENNVVYHVVDTIYRGYRSNQSSTRTEMTPFQRYINSTVEASIPLTHRIDLTDSNTLDTIRSPGAVLSISNSDFSRIDHASSAESNVDSNDISLIRVFVLVELGRLSSEIPNRTLLPDAMIYSNQSNSAILDLSFSPVEDPTAENAASVLSDVRRIYIYRLP